jgi:hypothetical protein
MNINGKIPLKGSKGGLEEEQCVLFCYYVDRAELTLSMFIIGLQDLMG